MVTSYYGTTILAITFKGSKLRNNSLKNMKIASYNNYQVGIVDGNTIRDVTTALPSFLEKIPEQRINWLINKWGELQPQIKNIAANAKPTPLTEIKLLSAN